MYSILPITEEERVAREILLNESPDLVIHVLDARNLERMLAMTIQLIEAGLPVVLVVNIMDEAERMGLQIDIPLSAGEARHTGDRRSNGQKTRGCRRSAS